jgi:hypothetical protein
MIKKSILSESAADLIKLVDITFFNFFSVKSDQFSIFN